MRSLLRKLREKLSVFLQYLLFRIDTTRYVFDKPHFDYQPLPWLGIDDAKVRGEATILRWKEIKTHLGEYTSLKDIGCCVGYFCLSAGSELGMDTIGFDMNPKHIRLAERARLAAGLEQCGFIRLGLNERNIQLLPPTGVTLLLSVWHHWVSVFGMDNASRMLEKTWERTTGVMLFESGEEEIMDEFDIPFAPGQSAKDWLKEYLKEHCDNSRVEIVGEFEAGQYEHYQKKGHQRSLFLVRRLSSET